MSPNPGRGRNANGTQPAQPHKSLGVRTQEDKVMTSQPHYNTRSNNTIGRETGERFTPGNSEIHDARIAQDFLVNRRFCPVDEIPETIETLVSTLFTVIEASTTTPKIVAEGEHTVGFLLLETNTRTIEATIKNAVQRYTTNRNIMQDNEHGKTANKLQEKLQQQIQKLKEIINKQTELE